MPLKVLGQDGLFEYVLDDAVKKQLLADLPEIGEALPDIQDAVKLLENFKCDVDKWSDSKKKFEKLDEHIKSTLGLLDPAALGEGYGGLTLTMTDSLMPLDSVRSVEGAFELVSIEKECTKKLESLRADLASVSTALTTMLGKDRPGGRPGNVHADFLASSLIAVFEEKRLPVGSSETCPFVKVLNTIFQDLSWDIKDPRHVAKAAIKRQLLQRQLS